MSHSQAQNKINTTTSQRHPNESDSVSGKPITSEEQTENRILKAIHRLFRRRIGLPLLLRLEHILQSISRSRIDPSQLFLLLLTHQFLFVCRGDVRIRGTTCQIPVSTLIPYPTSNIPRRIREKGKDIPRPV